MPSQWEGKTDDGRSVYIRYRFARFSVQVSDPGGTVFDAIDSPDVVFKEFGHPMDGTLTFAQMRRETEGTLDFSDLPEVVENG
jgi:hypothetical protein